MEEPIQSFFPSNPTSSNYLFTCILYVRMKILVEKIFLAGEREAEHRAGTPLLH